MQLLILRFVSETSRQRVKLFILAQNPAGKVYCFHSFSFLSFLEVKCLWRLYLFFLSFSLYIRFCEARGKSKHDFYTLHISERSYLLYSLAVLSGKVW